MELKTGYLKEVLMLTMCKQNKLINPKYQVVVFYSIGSDKDLGNKRVMIERETCMSFTEAQEIYNTLKQELIVDDNYISDPTINKLNKFECIINKEELQRIRQFCGK